MSKSSVWIISGMCGWLMLGCATQPTPKPSDIPDWYLNPPQAEDVLYAAGDAVKLSMALAKDAADARARDAIARTIEVKVSTMIKDFMQESGIGKDTQAQEFTSVVSKQVANTTLRGARIIKREMKVKDNQYHAFALAEYNLNSLIQETLNAARSKKALYDEAKASLGFEDLENEIKKLEAGAGK